MTGRELEHRADPREVVDLGRHLDRLLDTDPAIAGGREPLGVAISRPVAVVQVARTVTASAARSTPSSRRVSDGRPQPAQRAAIPPIRSLSVGARQRDRTGGAANEGWRRYPSSSSATSPVQP